MSRWCFLFMGLVATLCHGNEGGAARTEIVSKRLEMESLEKENRFYFYDNIEITGENLKVTCDKLEVIADRVASDSLATSSSKEIGSMRKIVAQGNVTLVQEGRNATAGRAEIFPQEGRVVLTENPVIEDSDGKVTGYKMTFYRGKRRAVVEASPSGERPKVTLPALPDLGFKEEVQKGKQAIKETRSKKGKNQ